MLDRQSAYAYDNVVVHNTKRSLIVTQEEDLKLNQVAQELGKSLEQVRRYVREGKLPARKLGMQWFVTRRDLDAFKTPDRKVNQQELLERIKVNRERIRARVGQINVLDLLDEVRGSRP